MWEGRDVISCRAGEEGMSVSDGLLAIGYRQRSGGREMVGRLIGLGAKGISDGAGLG